VLRLEAIRQWAEREPMTLETQKQIEETARPSVLLKASSDAPVKRSRHAFEARRNWPKG
jgi:hypothetical protein